MSTNLGDLAFNSPVSHTFRTTHTWSIAGEIKVPSTDTDFIPPFYIAEATNQTTKIIKARYRINGGTSVTAKLQQNGSDITGFTAISVTTTQATTDPADVDVADEDRIALVVTAVSGTPLNMSFTVILEHTVTT